MAFVSTSLIGAQLTNVDSTAQFALGTKTTAVDPVLGSGEFVYLKGVASTVAGSVVIFDDYAGTTTLVVAGSRGPAAVALAATVANTYGWYQIEGSAVVKETGATAGANVYATATAGVPSATTVAGDKIDGMRFKTADGTPSAGFAYAQIQRPSMNANG
jgi:hypothetical protein